VEEAERGPFVSEEAQQAVDDGDGLGPIQLGHPRQGLQQVGLERKGAHHREA
jgi:hypothetical protein